ncbi:minor tail protein [Microbacterium phage PhunaPhoke]|nr:minor tail protein [Microbacterium phage Neptune]UDL15510.1 minor tail protein [Microbacterium phage Cybele]WNT45025.1 minor tail protein [Microbacterium phage PhunaPhoke]
MPSQPLRPEDILVEYRDKNLVRQGSIPLDDLQLKMQPVVNGVGSWSLTLPAEHRAVPYLRTPGSGIIVTNLRTKVTLLSGPTSKPSKRATSADPVGMVTIAGLTDDRLLWDGLAFPNPSLADPLASSQSRANDVRTATGENLMRQYVAYNICGTHAPAGRLGGFRNKLRLEPVNTNLGFPSTRRPRFDILGDLLVGIAAEQNLAFRVVQVGSDLIFEVYAPTNRTDTIRLDINNGTLQEQNVEFAPPEVTRMVVAGQGEGTERQFLQMSTADSTTAEADWGLIIEEFKDQRNTDVVDELEAAALERLNEAGFTKVAVKATPANETTMIFMTDFFLGDRVSVVIDGQEQPNSHITEAAIVIDNTGIRTAVAIGDIADFDSDSALRQTVSDTQRRVDNLERNAEAMAPETMLNAFHPVGSIYMSTVNTNPGLIFGGTWVSWGAGRVPVGVNSADTDFNASEKTGGAKTHLLTAAESGLPQHTHVQNPHNHTQDAHNHTQNAHTHSAGGSADGFIAHLTAIDGSQSARWNTFASGTGGEVGTYRQPASTTATNNAATATNQAATAVNQNAGPANASAAHNNLQPYVTCYMWKRTA